MNTSLSREGGVSSVHKAVRAIRSLSLEFPAAGKDRSFYYFPSLLPEEPLI